MKNRYAAVLWVASLLPGLAIPAIGQQASSATEAAPSWTIDQAVTCSVHDAWELGGKSEAGFFAIVKALAELSAEKRGLVLPDKRRSAVGSGNIKRRRRRPIAISYCM